MRWRREKISQEDATGCTLPAMGSAGPPSLSPVGDDHPPRLEVHRLHLALDELHPPEEFPDRVHDVRHVEVAGGDLVEHGREEEEVLAVDERDLEARVMGQSFLEMEGGVDAAEPASQDQDPRALRSACVGLSHVSYPPLCCRSLAARPVHPVWWLAPMPAPLSP